MNPYRPQIGTVVTHQNRAHVVIKSFDHLGNVLTCPITPHGIMWRTRKYLTRDEYELTEQTCQIPAQVERLADGAGKLSDTCVYSSVRVY